MPQTAQAQTPFICADTTFISQGIGGNTGLYVVDYGEMPYGLDEIDAPETFSYNAIGFNIKDGGIYAVVPSNGEIISIDASETITNHGVSTPTTAAISGDVDGNGIYYTFQGTKLITFDTQESAFPANGTTYTLTRGFGADAVYNPVDGLLYSVSGGKLLMLDPADLLTTLFTTTAVTITSTPISTVGSTTVLNSAGAMWADALGRLFAYQNAGQIYEVTTAGVATFVSSASNVSSNDGTGCAYAPIVEKSVDPAMSAPGDVITYTIVMANGFRQTDLALNFVDQLPAGFTWVGGTYTITGDVVVSGTVNSYGGTDSITVTGITIEGGGVVTVTIDAVSAVTMTAGTYHNQAVMDDILPSLGGVKVSDWPGGPDKGEPTPHEIIEIVDVTIDKGMTGYVDVDGGMTISEGDVLTVTLTVTNESNTVLNGVMVTDTLPGVSALDCVFGTPVGIPADNLPPNGTIRCTAAYTVTQLDVDRGAITNTAAVTGTSPLTVTVTDEVSATVSIVREPELTLDKTATPTTDLLLDDVVTYILTATNTGNTTLINVTISDSAIGLTCPPVTLLPDDATSCTGTYSVTQDDVDAGTFVNSGRVTGQAPDGSTPVGSDDVTITAERTPAITLSKTATPTTGLLFNDTIVYTLIATNTGNTTLSSVTISDSLLGLVCPPTMLSPNDVVNCTGTYAVTQDDVDAGIITNTAIVTSSAPDGSAPMATDSVTVTAAQSPVITLSKTAAPTDGLLLSDTITYTLTATNTGNTTLISVTVSDASLGLVCPPITLLPNDIIRCIGIYTLSQSDVDAGVITNTATVTSRAPDGSFPSDVVTMTVTTEQTPSLELKKSAFSSAPFLAVGDTISYTLVATNTGNVTLAPAVISDTLATANPVCTGVLAPQEMLSCTITYTVTLTDVNNGTVINSATVHGNAPNGDGVDAADSVETPIAQSPQLTIDKRFVGDGSAVIPLNEGDLFTYTIVTTNTGNVTLDDVVVSDPLVGALNCTMPLSATLQPNDTISCTGTVTVTQMDVAVGIIENIATATGTAPDGNVVSDSDIEVVPPDTTANIELEKVLAFHDDVDGDGILSADDRLGYVITTTNSGFVPLNVVVTDTIIANLACIPAVPTALQPNETVTCTGAYTIDQMDTDAGEIVNIATATGTTFDGDDVTDSDTVIVPQPQSGELLFNKAVVPSSSGFALGDTVTYRFFAINIGNVTLNNVMITDTLPGLSPLACTQPLPADNFAPGDIVTCLATYTVTLDDANAGVIVNDASVSSDAPNGDVADENDVVVPIVQTPSIVVDKTAESAAPLLAVGDTITYTFIATNTGNVTLNNVMISDTLAGLSALQCTGTTTTTTLAPNDSVTCTATYTITLADVDNGAVVNTVTAFGDAPNGGVTAANDTEETPITQSLGLIVEKEMSESAMDGDPIVIGNVLTYTIVGTNTGNVTIRDVVVIDPLLGALDCSRPLPTTLAPDETVICTGSLTVTQLDVDAELIVNRVTATGVAPDGTTVSDTGSENVPPERTAAIELEKIVTFFDDVDQSRGLSVGDSLDYLIIVENRGVVSLTNVTISDTILPTLSCTPSITTPTTLTIPTIALQPAESILCTGSYTITQADVDAGEIVNTATVTATTPEGEEIGDGDTEIVPHPQRSRIAFSKFTTDTTIAVDDVITYTLLATNTGNVTLSDVVISDTLFGLGDLRCDQSLPAALSPNGTILCTAVYTVTQSDIDNGVITNVATVSGVDPNGDALFAVESETIEAVQTPAIIFNKALLPFVPPIELDDVLTYQFFAINIGNVTLDNVVISDTLPGLGALTCNQAMPADDFAPAETLMCTAAYTVTQSDIDNGDIINIATLSSSDPQGGVLDAEDDQAVEIEQRPSLVISKTAISTSPLLNPNDTISYTFITTNTGNVTIDNITLIEPLFGLSPLDCSATLPATLRPNESFTCTATYTVTLLDVDDGSVSNSVTVFGNEPSGGIVGNFDSTDSPIVQSPQLTADKFLANNSTEIAAGDTLTYTIITTNTGNVSIENVIVSDPLLESIVCESTLPTTLLPGQSITCSGQYTVTQIDVNRGNVTNTVTAMGNAPDGTPVDDSDNEDATLDTTPNLEVQKSLLFHDDVDGNGDMSVGDRLEYMIVAANSGRVTISDLIITDTIVADITCDQTLPVTLDPNESVTCTAVYTITQTDIDRGEIINIATAHGETPSDDPIQDSDTEILPQPRLPDLLLEKVIVDKPADLIVGDVITFMLTAMNTGNLTLDGVVISDTVVGVSALMCDQPQPVDDFAPNDIVTCSATYTVTQTDVDNGTVNNTATVTGFAPDGSALSTTDTERVRGNPMPELLFHKASIVPSGADIGTVITYTFVATNTGNVTLNDVTIADSLGGLSLFRCDRPLSVDLLPEETVSCVANYTLKAFDFTLGMLMNSATAVGTSSDGTAVESSAADSLQLVRPTPTPTNTPSPTPIPTNTPTPTSTPIPTATSLPTNTPTNTPTPETAPPLSVPIPISELTPTLQPTEPAEPTVELNQVATFDPNGETLTGMVTLDFGVVNYIFTITNTGSTPLTHVIVDDPSIMIIGDPVDLDVGERATFLGRYVLTPEDYAAGFTLERAAVTVESSGMPIMTINAEDDVPNDMVIAPSGFLGGMIWHDLDVSQDRMLTADDVPLSGIHVHLLRSDGSFVGEATTDNNGGYRFINLPLNEIYTVVVDTQSLPFEKREIPTTYETDALSDDLFVAMLTFDQPIIRQINFAYVAADFGDLPENYNGVESLASHAMISSQDQFFLGDTIDYEAVDQPANMADGDQDDGVIVIGSEQFTAGERKLVKVKVSGKVPSEGVDLGVWFDWDHDGGFTDEEFSAYRFSNNVPNGTVTLPNGIDAIPYDAPTLLSGTLMLPSGIELPITPPNDYKGGVLFARFRLFAIDGAPGGTLDWTDFTGHAVNGEVEDYVFADATVVTLQTQSSTVKPLALTLALILTLTVTLPLIFQNGKNSL